MLVRPDPAKLTTLNTPVVHVISARRLEYNGARAIHIRLPYKQVEHYFQAEDGDAIEVYAELTGDHLELYERTSKAEFFITQEQGSLPVH